MSLAKIDRPYAARHPLDDAHLPAGAAPLPTGEERLPTARRTSYEWKNVFVHVDDAHRTVVCIASPDGVKHIGRSIEHVFRLYEDVRPRGRGALDNRATRGPRWGAARRPTDRARLRRGRSMSDPRAARCLRSGASRRPTDRVRLRQEQAGFSERMHRVVRPAHDRPRAVDVIAPMQECRSYDRMRKRLRPKQGNLRTRARAPPVEGHTSQPRLHCRIRRGPPRSQSGEPTPAGLPASPARKNGGRAGDTLEYAIDSLH
jgi:hypothetical protein